MIAFAVCATISGGLGTSKLRRLASFSAEPSESRCSRTSHGGHLPTNRNGKRGSRQSLFFFCQRGMRSGPLQQCRSRQGTKQLHSGGPSEGRRGAAPQAEPLVLTNFLPIRNARLRRTALHTNHELLGILSFSRIAYFESENPRNSSLCRASFKHYLSLNGIGLYLRPSAFEINICEY